MEAIAEMEAEATDTMAKVRQARRKPQTLGATPRIPAQERLSRLDPARRPAVEDRLSQMPKTARGAYLLAVAGRSPKAAIKAQCWECCGWVRSEVAACTALACPLWSYRPF
jgi:hypothetical protein